MPQPFVMTNTIDQLLGQLLVLQRRDVEIEAEVSATGMTAGKWWGGFAVCVILFIISSMIEASWLVVLAVIAGIVCLVFGIIWSAKRSRWQALDMEDRRLALAQHVLTYLGKDMPPKARCAVAVSFDDYRTHGQLVSQQRSGFFGSLRVLKYTDTWFSARGRLYDGNRFRITVEQQIRRKEKSKRKYTKVNERITEEVTLLLRINAACYPHCARLAQALQPGDFQGIKITRVLAQGDRVRVTCETAPALHFRGRGGSTNNIGDELLATGDTLLQLFLFVYTQLQACRGEQAQAAQ